MGAAVTLYLRLLPPVLAVWLTFSAVLHLRANRSRKHMLGHSNYISINQASFYIVLSTALSPPDRSLSAFL